MADQEKLVYHSPEGAEVDPVKWFRTVWQNNAMPSIAFDILGYFIACNAMNFFPELDKYKRVPHDEDCAVRFRARSVKLVRLDDLMSLKYWERYNDDYYKDSRLGLMDNVVKKALEYALSGDLLVEGSLRFKLSLSSGEDSTGAIARLELVWMEKAK